MIYHLIGLSPYTNNIIKMLVSHQEVFNLDNHFFLIDATENKKFKIEQLGEINHSMLDNPWGFLRTLHNAGNEDSVIIHQLTNPRLFLYLYLNRGTLNKCIWSIWGGDVYFFMNRSRSIKYNVIEYLRRAIIPGIPLITSWIKGDYEVVRTVYKSQADYISSFYPVELDYGLINTLNCSPRVIDKEKPYTILVGNSGAPESNHFEVLELLSRFKNDNIVIIAPLSYGDKDYINAVIERGKSIFGNKFKQLTEFVTSTTYTTMLSEVDVAIMNSNRSHALGNVITLLLLRKKVFMKSFTTPFGYFTNIGIRVFDVGVLEQQSLEELMEIAEHTKETNAAVMADVVSEKNAVNGWKRVFEYCQTGVVC